MVCPSLRATRQASATRRAPRKHSRLSKAWVYDAASDDAFDVLSSGLGAVGLIFALQKDDLTRLSELLSSMGITALSATVNEALEEYIQRRRQAQSPTSSGRSSSRRHMTTRSSGAGHERPGRHLGLVTVASTSQVR
jgi:hypothetical protein